MRVLRFVAVFVALVVALVFLIASFRQCWHWFEVHSGTVNESGPYYGFWSGFGSDIAEATLMGVILAPVIGVYNHHKCTTCRRIGRHTTPDTAQKFCHHHWTRDHVCEAKRRHKLRFPHHLAHNPHHHAECFGLVPDPRELVDTDG